MIYLFTEDLLKSTNECFLGKKYLQKAVFLQIELCNQFYIKYLHILC